jgi:hypothetical protein
MFFNPYLIMALLLAWGLFEAGQRLARRVVSPWGKALLALLFVAACGTELWYLMRYARRQGVRVRLRHEADLETVPIPAMLGTRTGGYGHFITLLGRADDSWVIGDPLRGRLTLTPEAFHRSYAFGGCVLQVSP